VSTSTGDDGLHERLSQRMTITARVPSGRDDIDPLATQRQLVLQQYPTWLSPASGRSSASTRRLASHDRISAGEARRLIWNDIYRA
jgi:hypothetical protein